MHKTKLVLLTAAALLAITSGAEAAKVKRSSGFSMETVNEVCLPKKSSE